MAVLFYTPSKMTFEGILWEFAGELLQMSKLSSKHANTGTLYSMFASCVRLNLKMALCASDVRCGN